jgi:Domain of unknown function (DUF4062)/inactive STAND
VTASEITKVFISATKKDLESYRVDLQSALRTINTQALLQEEWTDAAIDVVGLCIRRLEETDGYVGVFGFRYGWIPKGYDCSITEIECDHAFKKWRHPQHKPVFLFVPEAGTLAAEELEKRAEALLLEDFPDEQQRQTMRDRQCKLRESLTGKFAGSFTDSANLTLRVVTTISNWNLTIYKNASQNVSGALSDIPLASLGAIGRERQLELLEEEILAFKEKSSPGLCVLVHGPEDAGQRAFLAFLGEWDVLEIDTQPIRITPPHDRFDGTSLRNAALAALTENKAPPEAAVERLADAVSSRCEHGNLLMVTGRLERLAGGVEAFCREFWTPLLKALGAADRQKPRRQFFLVAALAEPLRDPLPAAAQNAGPGDEAVPASVIILPELGAISKQHVADWLKQFDLDIRQRRELAEDAVAIGERPAAVFARLNARNFWTSLKPKRK